MLSTLSLKGVWNKTPFKEAVELDFPNCRGSLYLVQGDQS
jgi:hypothetical protein